MAGQKFIEFAGVSFELDDAKAGIQSSINCYPQRLEGDKYMMAASPGEVTIASLSDPVRGSRLVEDRWFVVVGSSLYELTTAGVATNRGTIATFTGFVGMSHNETQLAIVDGSNLYIFALATNTLTQITVAGWRGSDDVHELDGYFIFVDPNTQQFYLSAIDDGSVLNALDFSSADSSPDNIVTHRLLSDQLWLFGTYSTEIWTNSGEPSFPFIRYRGYRPNIGIAGKRAAINAADTLFWVGQTRRGSGIVYMAAGNQPQRVSTIAIEERLLSSTDLSAATMWAYQIQGHEFIGINAPGLDTTLVYDAALKLWHERAEWDDQWFPLRSRLITAIGTEQYGCDDYGVVTRFDPTINTLSGRTLVRERTFPHMMKPSLEPVQYFGLEAAMTTGEGVGSVTLQLSNDGGTTFGPMLLRGLGATGRRMERIRWLGLGTAFNRVFRIRMSDNVPFGLHSVSIDTQ